MAKLYVSLMGRIFDFPVRTKYSIGMYFTRKPFVRDDRVIVVVKEKPRGRILKKRSARLLRKTRSPDDDPVSLSGPNTRLQTGAIPLIRAVAHDPSAGRAHPLRSLVRRSVVDDNDLVVVFRLFHDVLDPGDRIDDTVFFVVGRNDDADQAEIVRILLLQTYERILMARVQIHLLFSCTVKGHVRSW